MTSPDFFLRKDHSGGLVQNILVVREEGKQGIVFIGVI